jgi:hydrogenase/urease accessory protein HupE
VRKTFLLLVALFFLILGARSLFAHEVRPGYLELRQTGPETYDAFWKVPARGDLRLGLYVGLPENCENIAPTRSYQEAGAFTERWSVACKGGLTNNRIIINGLSATFTDVLVSVESSEGTAQVVKLTPSSPSFIVEAAPSGLQVAGTYLRLGVEHILLGIDHLLFILALLLIVKGWRRLIGTITAFTVAHSITLAAATLGFVHVPQQPVEAAIALSIVFVAGELVHGLQGRPGLTERWPWVVAFVFGLLHGFGFASALRAVGLPEQSIPLALFLFNIGVELGQLFFVAAVVSVLFVVKTFLTKQRVSILTASGFVQLDKGVAYIIGSLAFYWVFERVYAFWQY